MPAGAGNSAVRMSTCSVWWSPHVFPAEEHLFFIKALIACRLLYKSDRRLRARSHSCAILPLYRGGPFTRLLSSRWRWWMTRSYTRMLHRGLPSRRNCARRSWFRRFRQVLARRLEQGATACPACCGHSERMRRLHLPRFTPGRKDFLPADAGSSQSSYAWSTSVKNMAGECEQGLSGT